MPCSRAQASGADDEPMWLPGLADPVHLDEDHAFAADVGQVDEHQRASLDGAQPGGSPLKSRRSRKIIDSGRSVPRRPTDRCQGGGWQLVEQVIGDGSQCQSATRDLAVGRLDDLGGIMDCVRRSSFIMKSGRSGLTRERCDYCPVGPFVA